MSDDAPWGSQPVWPTASTCSSARRPRASPPFPTTGESTPRRTTTAIAVGVAALVLAACAGSDDPARTAVAPVVTTAPTDAATGTPAPTSALASTAPSTEAPADAGDAVGGGRVVALGEEFLLADLLALGVQPVASTATVPSTGFVGVDQYDTDGIEILSSTEPNLEQLAALRPDVIVTTRFIAAEAGEEALATLGDLVVLPDGTTSEERLLLLAERFGVPERGEELVAELEAARGELRSQVAARTEPCVVSVATIYPGPSVAAWVDGTTAIPAAVLDTGCALVPGPDAGSPDRNGRLFLSLEQLSLLEAPTLLTLQSDVVEGETDAVASLQGDPLWQQIPAVAAGGVVELDRLGYPGVPGQLRLVADLAEVLPAAP
jgi:iron complex transport system substrate-binding protein